MSNDEDDYKVICVGCGKECAGNMAPMLHDEVWHQLAEDRDILCYTCFDDRASERGIEITLASLKPCPFNLMGWPKSYFNQFLDGSKPLLIDSEWVNEARREFSDLR